jgi:hypothetical protein
MENVTRTIYSTHLQTCIRADKPVTIFTGSTLNEKWGVLPNSQLTAGMIPKDNYFAIGNGGADYTSGLTANPKLHLPTHCSLYNQIPFIARPVHQDLPSTLKAKYRLRKVINGVAYYFLKVIDKTGVTVTTEVRNVVGGSVTPAPFSVADSDKLPVPPSNSSYVAGAPLLTYYLSTANVNIVLTPSDLTEIVNACALLFNNTTGPYVINEFAICSGVDVGNTTEPINGTMYTYTEVIAAQISAFLYKFFAIQSGGSATITLPVNLGCVFPQTAAVLQA